MLQWLLQAEGPAAGRLHVSTLMNGSALRHSIDAQTPRSRRRGKIYPYLLRKLLVTHSNHIWAMDITYIPMARDFVYLAAVVDWSSRKVLSWRLSITMELTFASRPSRKPWPAMADRRSSTRSGFSVHQHGLHPPADHQRNQDQHGRQRCLAR